MISFILDKSEKTIFLNRCQGQLQILIISRSWHLHRHTHTLTQYRDRLIHLNIISANNHITDTQNRAYHPIRLKIFSHNALTHLPHAHIQHNTLNTLHAHTHTASTQRARAAGPSWLFNAFRQPSYLVSYFRGQSDLQILCQRANRSPCSSVSTSSSRCSSFLPREQEVVYTAGARQVGGSEGMYVSERERTRERERERLQGSLWLDNARSCLSDTVQWKGALYRSLSKLYHDAKGGKGQRGIMQTKNKSCRQITHFESCSSVKTFLLLLGSQQSK